MAHKSISHIHENITEILTLHEKLLNQLASTARRWKGLHENHNYRRSEKPAAKHTRWKSNDGPIERRVDDELSTRLIRRSLDLRAIPSPGEYQLVCEPKETAEIALTVDSMVLSYILYLE